MYNNPFLPKEYLAIALIEIKQEIFNEDFITTSELNQFNVFMQKQFNNRNLGIVINSSLDREDFNITNGIITPTGKCCYNLYMLPNEISKILNDKSLILKFFIQLENNKLKKLTNIQSELSIETEKTKIMSLKF